MAIKTTFRSEKEFRSITKLIAEELRGAIVAGKIAPGEQLIEDQLAGTLKAARLAVERGNAEETARLAALHQLLRLAYRERNLEKYFEANWEFHHFIAQMARNNRLHRLISEMRQEISKTRLLGLQLPQRMDYSMREHDQILDAFLKRNPELAESKDGGA